MMTSSRPRGDVGDSFARRRGHLSISDPSHHVTEAIGTLYGDEDDSGSEGGRPLSDGRPLSFIGGPSPYQEQLPRPPPEDQLLSVDTRRGLPRSEADAPVLDTTSINGGPGKKPQALSPTQRSNSFEQSPKSPLSPTLSLRDVQDSQFSLTNIDNPNDIAQELSNLQALRRLSMDVANNKDPDLPPMSLMAMPAIAPTGDDDENDPSRLLWVPARVHPELAPTEFKSFLENRVHSIRRRSGDSFLSADSETSQTDSTSGGLRRKKSMLSRQIDNSGGYVDGADRLERKRSRGHSHELSLEELVKDPTKAVQKLAQESQVPPTGPESSADDMPILPAVPGMGLRRSTRTQYRKGGSLRSGGPLSRRAGHRHQPSQSTESLSSTLDAPKGFGLTRVQSEPLSENHSRPNRSIKRTHKFSQESLGDYDYEGTTQDTEDKAAATAGETFQDQLPIRSSSNMPTIETSSHDEASPFPKRSSSQKTGSQAVSQGASEPEPPVEESPRSSRRSVSRQTVPQSSQPQYTSRSSYPQGQSLSDNLAANPAPLPGGGATRTDSLTFIPTLPQEERKPEKKSKKDRDDDSSSTKSSGSAWKWFKSGTDDKDKKKEESRKSKTKSVGDKGQDNARLDVIQTSIDKNSSKGRESLVLDRDNVESKLQEERKKESHRKSDSKRDKDGIFASFFGGSKKKEEKEKEKNAKKSQHLKVPEEPVYKPLVPDMDYHWTRFPLLEERAIYRMAHIKLANPRRSLLSQVLLSNFMYSYLAIVQAMHPQMNVPVSPQQKRLEEEARRKQQEEEYLAQQRQEEQDAQDSIDQYNFDYHRAAVQYADSGDGEVDYVDDAQIYEDEHGKDHHDDYDYDGSDGYGQGVKEYYQYHDTGDDRDRRHDGRDDMW